MIYIKFFITLFSEKVFDVLRRNRGVSNYLWHVETGELDSAVLSGIQAEPMSAGIIQLAVVTPPVVYPRRHLCCRGIRVVSGHANSLLQLRVIHRHPDTLSVVSPLVLGCASAYTAAAVVHVDVRVRIDHDVATQYSPEYNADCDQYREDSLYCVQDSFFHNALRPLLSMVLVVLIGTIFYHTFAAMVNMEIL